MTVDAEKEEEEEEVKKDEEDSVFQRFSNSSSTLFPNNRLVSYNAGVIFLCVDTYTTQTHTPYTETSLPQAAAKRKNLWARGGRIVHWKRNLYFVEKG